MTFLSSTKTSRLVTTSFSFFLPFAISLSLFSPVSASSSNGRQSEVVRAVHQFPSHLENIAVRSNGNRLISYLAARPTADIIRRTVTHTFPNNHTVCGIQEIAEDVFAVINDILNLETIKPIGNFTVWHVEMMAHGATADDITHLPDAGFPDGLTVTVTSPATAAAP
ncbi:hypothetical protein EMCG_02622 [[Emmonsia] crescens]|uniref:Uncharacterized protein n=1 Tax=[Emmonsia] crescens TaxID=73230 RepID=A0A0G2J8X8_9EURO|nr:hypothetical protein EMCG_02622 [Emmonsia crescens UAMH 3008]